MNKKGIIIPIMTIFGLIILLYAAYSVYPGKMEFPTGSIGKLQLEIIELQQEGEARLFYLDQIAKYAAQDVLNKMIQENKMTEKMFVDDFRKEFESEFINSLNIAYFDVPKEYDFEVRLEKNKLIITGNAKKELVLSPKNAKPGVDVKYGVEHDFIQEISYESEKR